MAGPSTIDVLIVYTSQARAFAGGTPVINAFVDSITEVSNLILSNSEVDATYRVVNATEITDLESGNFSVELNQLYNTSDGVFDSAHTLRNTFGADIVTLIVSHTQGGTTCGRGYLMRNPTPSFQSFELRFQPLNRWHVLYSPNFVLC